MFRFTPQVWLIVLVTVLFGLFLLPQFSIPVQYKAYEWLPAQSEEGEEAEAINLLTTSLDELPEDLERTEVTKDAEIGWTGIDLALFGIESPLTNFKKGSEIYPGITYVYRAGTLVQEVFEADINLIRRRMDVAGIRDVNLVTVIDEDTGELELQFPPNYTPEQARVLSSLLVAPGGMRFFESDISADANTEVENIFYQQLLPGFVPIEAQIVTSDIQNVNVVSRTEYFLPVWQMTFKDSAMEKVRATLNRYGIDPELAANDVNQQAAGIPIYTIEIDGLPQYVITYVQGNEFTAVPLGLLSSLGEVRVTASYVISSSLVSSNFEIQGDTYEATAHLYATEGRAQLAWFFLLSAAFAIYTLYRRYGKRGMIAGTIITLFTFTFAISILKLVANPISIGLVLAVSISLALLLYFVERGLRSTEAENEDVKMWILEISAFAFVLNGLLYLSGSGFADYQDVVAVLAIMGATIFMSVWLIWDHIFNWYFAENE